jgi:rod shape-determining protein MreC
VLSPVRNAIDYVGSTFSAKSKLASVERRYAALVKQYAKVQYEGIQYRKAAGLIHLDQVYGIRHYGPLAATVIGGDAVLWYGTITVDRGSSSGVRYRDPVVGPSGLIGDVTTVNTTTSVVSLITSPNFAVGATIENQSGASGLIQPKVGDPSTLVLTNLPASSNVSNNQLVVTSGFQYRRAPTIESFAPAGIPIGTVSSTDPQSSLLESQSVQVTPLADLQHLSLVQILTRPHN